jgi:predicted flap endonuclease-1-like 5' DNA nuclease
VHRRSEQRATVPPPTSAPAALGDAPSPSRAPGVAWLGEIRGRAAPAPDLPPPAAELPPAEELAAVAVEPTPVETPTPAEPPSEWTVRTAPPPTAAATAPDVGAAVAAAQVAVEAVLAKSGLDPEARNDTAFGKPSGLNAPLGRRDDLKQINGLRQEDESMLNGIGVFHFDQIAEWDQKEILWLENHLFERGRIAREGWQAQAAELMRTRADDAGGVEA